MKKVLFTGGTGLVGKNVLPFLKEYHNVIAPRRQELDLKNTLEVEQYVRNGNFDVIVHSANPNPVKNSRYDMQDTMLEDSLRIFMNLYRVRRYCEKLIYLGSGAECDKTAEITSIKESDIERVIPNDIYGFAKYIMNELAQSSTNVYNLRLFACYGPYDHESKFITHCIRCCLKNEAITIRQNCIFDYIHVFDLGKVILYAIEHELKEHVYNVGSGHKYSLLEIAQKVQIQMKSTNPIIILNKGWNKEYTPDITRLEVETDLPENFISIDEGIALQIAHERKQMG
ncbi:NAD-dependent epimerase/dehydratase family protein [Murimonas intestini]|uniref:NAD-dependent epimerase/dehydratase family protein n=1 Tax=Murimonas intestini TaxID=1337051 RepID=UPI0011DE0F2B|nr:NAD(P)-dependent oxidoreductase [Murimonas intestini]